MTPDNRIKLFLLSSVDYVKDSATPDRYIASMLSVLRHYSDPIDKEHEILERGKVFYRESGEQANACAVSALEAISMGRGLSMAHIKTFSHQSTDITARIPGVGVRDVNSNLFYDSHACFLLITEVCIDFADGLSTSETIGRIFHNRSSFTNLGIDQYMAETFRAAAGAVISTINKASGSRASLSESDLNFQEENTLPLLMCGRKLSINMEGFRNEEVVADLASGGALAKDYPGAFFHPGWNYTIATGFPYEVLVNLLQIMIRAQTFFFSLGYMKSYFSDELSYTLREKAKIGEKEVDAAEEVRLAFHDLLAKFNAYKNKLFPKFHTELCAVLDRWHCNGDIEDIKHYIELNFQAKEKIHNSKVENQNDRQNKALAFIAVLQLVSIYGAFADGSTLFSERTWLFQFGTAVWVVSLVVFLLLSKYFRTAALFSLGALIFGLATNYWLGTS